jgi:hypothetical protein
MKLIDDEDDENHRGPKKNLKGKKDSIVNTEVILNANRNSLSSRNSQGTTIRPIRQVHDIVDGGA